MKTTTPRLRSVRFKSGGAGLRVIRNIEIEETRRSFEQSVKHVRDKREDDIIGYAIVAWARDGSTSSAFDFADHKNVSTPELAQFVKDVLSQHILA